MKKVLAVLVAAMALVAGGGPAGAAGGWAVTYLDPVPSRFEAGESYALGFWVLQHGTHPFEGKMWPVGLRLTGEDGRSLQFSGTALPEAAHYLASVVVPKGVWKVEGVQGPFQPYEIGTLTVPGGLRLEPLAPELEEAIAQGGHEYWGQVRPPGFAAGDVPVAGASPGSSASAASASAASAPASLAPGSLAPALPASPGPSVPASSGVSAAGSSSVAVSPAAREGGGGGVPAYTLLLAAGGGAVLVWVVLGLPAVRRRRMEEEPDQASADTIVISG
ncbi:hypothetical protein [Nonomuraea gerenzanensis]|uniref:Uncharacterized protein n=1 Tax=Nonomuraea gerenzanensis TaxID=93944 RepID=A0A1M4EKD2_9ACTN|nr:hypothetical protein [Nonomuraea gerenzanensis]UBU19157.1 hypothetical protein LCN96_42130 [Nonomuraea gerenzanensis]SBO99311.1 hypothetical protein BN4615_P8827 [Nonomuraea gerenzanensis]